MNLFNRYTFAMLLSVAVVACNQPNSDPDAAKRNAPSATVTGLEPNDIVEMLSSGAKLYWGVLQQRGSATTTLNGARMVQLDAAAFPSLQALRQRFAGMFTERAVDTLIADLGVKESGGKLWIPDADPDDISVYDDADVTQKIQNGDTVMVTVDVPLGDSGQSDLRGVRLVRKGDAWRIDNNPFSDVEEDANEEN